MTPALLDAVDELDVVVVESPRGIQMGWRSVAVAASESPVSAAGAVAGVITGNIAALMAKTVVDGVRDGAPSRRAKRASSLLNSEITPYELGLNLRDVLDDQRDTLAAAFLDEAEGDALIAELATGEVADNQVVEAELSVERRQSASTLDPELGSRFDPDDQSLSFNRPRVSGLPAILPREDTLFIQPDYTLSADGRTLRVVADVRMIVPGLDYVGPYGQRVRGQSGVYANRFAYFSERLPTPFISPETKADLKAALQQSFVNTFGPERRPSAKQRKALEEAADTIITPSEEAMLAAYEWTRDDAKRLRSELEAAHVFITQALIADLASTEVPDPRGDHIQLQASSSRRVVKLGNGRLTGAYISEPAQQSLPADFGNATTSSRRAPRRAR